MKLPAFPAAAFAAVLACLGIAIGLGSTVRGQVPVSSPSNKHNLSVNGTGTVRSTGTTEICIFCHAPHNTDPAPPLWNHMQSGTTYTPYTSTTMAATPGAPTGSAKLCLSCHDGTVAVGATVSRGLQSMAGVDASGHMTGAAVLGSNLSDDHPISFVPVTGPQIVNPPAGDPVKLDVHGELQCRSCHDPHKQEVDAVVKKFLVKDNASSALCLTCHQKTFWSTTPASHRTSTKSYTAAQGAHTGYTTVASNGCESCHKPHSATSASRMLKDLEEKTCDVCHGPNAVASTNIAAEFNKTYAHPVYRITPSVHDASESTTGATRLPETSAAAPRHAECADCHNPHAAHANATVAPKGSGKLAGVWGIDATGVRVDPGGAPPSVNQYEICFKCHADSANRPQPNGPDPPYAARVATQFNKRLQFDLANPSFHPVEGPGRGSFVPSLVSPWTTSSIVFCTDCHGNDSGPDAPTPGAGPAGLHGSTFKHLLVARYDMDNGSQVESAATYALCYKCHSRTSILGNASFTQHSRHLQNASAPCSLCHDPHGISSAQGNSTNNAHLINFDTRFVSPNSSGIRRYESTGQGHGRCYLLCHGQDHNPRTY
ncbi:MAG TPA: cytochrome c3 family protein [Vicinamibacterales bacterium]|nr:cytochrome c3 family protein [Vicinamibacterales bacterium]